MQDAEYLSINSICAVLQNGRVQEAERQTRAYLASHPLDEDGLLLLGICLNDQGRSAEAIEPYRELIRLKPNSATYWNNLGTVLRGAGQVREAEDAYRRAIELDPDDYQTAMNLGLLFLERGIYPQARDCFMAAHRIDPEAPEARIYAAQMCFALDSHDMAQRLLEPWPSWHDLPHQLALELAILMTHFSNAEEGTRIIEGLLRENPDDLRAIAHLAGMFERVNRLDEARAMLARLPPAAAIADVAIAEEVIRARATLALREPEPAAARGILDQLLRDQQSLQRRANSGDSNPWRQENLYFTLAKICDKQGDTEGAMRALSQAHAQQIQLVSQSLPELLAPDAQMLYTATKWLDAKTYTDIRDPTAPKLADSPIFIVGFPRSGTTMLEQMLDAHPGLKAMDERAFLQVLVERMGAFGYNYPYDLDKLDASQCAQLRTLYWELTAKVAPRQAGQRLVDKNPMNMLRLPLIHRLFPDSPIILALRHPCDVILSNYMQHFNSNMFAVLCSTLERLARGYVTAFDFWLHHEALLKPNVLHLRYEDLLDDFPAHVERIGRFLDLEDALPLRYFDQHARDKGFISTPSYSQVIEPPNKKAVDRWRRYHEYFEPVIPILERLVHHFRYRI